MEIITIGNDIKVFYVTARSFPDGIMTAHQELHALAPFSTERKYFGISRPEGGAIIYRAAATELYPGEAEELHCSTLALKNGNYISTKINDYTKDVQSIDRTFKELLTQQGLDPEGYCVERYLNNKDVQCMIRLDQ